MDKAKLQRPSPAPPLLNQMMRQVLQELELISQVRAARMGSETARLKSEGSKPSGQAVRMAESFQERYAGCNNNWDRLMVIRAAQRARKGAGRAQEAQRRGTKSWKRAIANDTRTSAEVANERGISAGHVRKLRGRHRMS